MKLIAKTTHNSEVITTNLKVADGFWTRFLGLMGRSSMEQDEALWIYPCNSIHTCFMRFSIDAVFLDRDFRVVSVCENIKPFRFIWPQTSAKSVLEFPGGSVRRWKIQNGMELKFE